MVVTGGDPGAGLKVWLLMMTLFEEIAIGTLLTTKVVEAEGGPAAGVPGIATGAIVVPGVGTEGTPKPLRINPASPDAIVVGDLGTCEIVCCCGGWGTGEVVTEPGELFPGA